jgi:predicted kinase
MSDWTQAKFNHDLLDNMAEKICWEYQSLIAIPQEKPMRQFILCPVGLVGSGKTSVVKPLAEKLSLVRISSDEIRQRLKEGVFNYNRAKELTCRIAQEFIKDGYSVVLDMNCGSPTSKEYIAKFKKEYDIMVLWIHINPPEDFILHKLKSYSHSWLFENGDEAVDAYFKYKKAYGDFGLIDFVYTIDPSRDDLPQQIDNATSAIRLALQ